MNSEGFFEKHSSKIVAAFAVIALFFLVSQCVQADEDLTQPPSISDYNGDLGTMNLHSEYSWCVSKRMQEMGVGGQGAAAILAMQAAEDACSVTIRAAYETAQMKYRKEIAQAQAPKWWHRLIPSGDAILGFGFRWVDSDNRYDYMTKRDEAMFGAFESLGSSQPSNIDITGGEGSIDLRINDDSPGSFNQGDTAFDSQGSFGSGGTAFDSDRAFGSESFNDPNTETTQDSFNVD